MTLRCTVLAGLVAALFAPRSEAVVTVSFIETPSAVVATISGTMIVPGFAPNNISGDNAFKSTANFACLLTVTNSRDVYRDGFVTNSPLLLDPTSTTLTGSFGYCGQFLYLDDQVIYDDVFEASGSWIWSGFTLEEIGLGDAEDSPFTVYTAASGDVIQLHVIPEAEVCALLLFGAIPWLARRKRYL